MTIIYIITKFLTIPGALLKGFWEQVFCRAFKSPVESNDYIRLDELCGHTGHELIPTSARSFWFNFLSGYFNYTMGLAMIVGPIINMFILDFETTTAKKILTYVVLWIGVSLLSNVFPLVEDALNMWEKIYGKDNKSTVIGKIFFFIPAVVMMIGSFLESYGITTLINFGAVIAIALFV